MLEDIRDWVMDTYRPLRLRLMWHGIEQLHFSDGVHYYRMQEGDSWRVDVARINGFCRWGPDTDYYMMQLPCTKQGLIRLVRICQHLTDNLEIYEDDDLPLVERYADLGMLDIGPVYEIDTTGLTRLEVLDKVRRYLDAEIKAWVTLGEVPHLKDIESLVDIVIGSAQH